MVAVARKLAYEVLLRVERGGYASDLLHARSAGLDARDAGLANQIVMGVLRYQAQLDYLIARHGPRRLDPEVRAALRMGVYQLRHLDRVPAHAAVGESVELVKLARKRSAAPLVNAILRKTGHEPAAWPDRATALSTPAWLLARWDRQYGRETADAAAQAFLEPPETFVRTTSVGGPRIQDIGSQSIVPLLDLKAGQTFLDLCAAPGNKTAQALESGVKAVAADLHPRRLRALGGLGVPLVALDGTRALPFRSHFDRILVDAPCSGTGTLGRNPEIKWRLRPANLEELHARQVALLENALEVLAPKGILVYSTCSLEKEENEDVVAGRNVIETLQRIPGRDRGDGFFAAVIKSG